MYYVNDSIFVEITVCVCVLIIMCMSFHHVSFNLHTLGIWSTSQPNGLAVPEASMHPVKSTEDVLELMEMGQMNRAVGATALNLRSSRSHRYLGSFL